MTTSTGQGSVVTPPVSFRPRRLAHANLAISDLERSMQFYISVCGLEEVFRERQLLAGFVGNGNTHHDIALVEIGGEKGAGSWHTGRRRSPGLNHLAFEMRNEIDLTQAYSRAIATGLGVHRTIDHGLAHSVFLKTPDEVQVEFYADMLTDWRGFWRDHVGKVVSGPWSPDDEIASVESYFTDNAEIHSVVGAPLRPKRIARATMGTRDLELAKGFWHQVAGLQVAQEDGEAGWAVLGGALGGRDLVLFRADSDEEVGLHHLTFDVMSSCEVHAAQSALEELRVEVQSVSADEKSSLFLRDPDGVLLEFIWEREVGRSGLEGLSRHDTLLRLS
jgi:catechol 2,3-dioxygenase